MVKIVREQFDQVFLIDVPTFVMEDARWKGMCIADYVKTRGVWVFNPQKDTRHDN